MNSARLTDVILEDNTTLQLYKSIPNKYLHSEKNLTKATYSWQGEVHIQDIGESETICVIDTYAYRARKSNGQIVRLKTGGYKFNDSFRIYKLMGIIRNDRLYIVVKEANQKVADIASLAPVRVNGVAQAHRVLARFSFTDTHQKLA